MISFVPIPIIHSLNIRQICSMQPLSLGRTYGEPNVRSIFNTNLTEHESYGTGDRLYSCNGNALHFENVSCPAFASRLFNPPVVTDRQIDR